jgi:hypothetical protein
MDIPDTVAGLVTVKAAVTGVPVSAGFGLTLVIVTLVVDDISR